MMYVDKFVVAIKVNGRVLRESGDTVSLPFGSEYSILIKNLNSVRSQINVSVDGQDVAGNLVIPANSSLELERFIRNGNLTEGNRFKFIQRTSEVEAHRGIGAEDGLVRVEAFRERVQKFVDVPIPRYYDDPIPVPRPYYPPWNNPRYWENERSVNTTMASTANTVAYDSIGNAGAAAADSLDSGITAAGSISNQKFRHVSGFPLETPSTVLVLRLRGAIGGQPIETPITVERKPECGMCGKSNDATSQFCDRCGAGLVLV